MRVLLVLLMFASVASAETVSFESLQVFDPLPAYVDDMPDDLFRKWAQTQNEMQYRRVRQKADEWDSRNPDLDVYVDKNDYTSKSDLTQSENASSGGSSVGSTSNTQYSGQNYRRAYRCRTRWCGGPVPLINPYWRSQK